jgi:hypothetical protein
MKRVLVPIIIAACCVGAPAAEASRKATVKETRSIAFAMKAPSKCIRAYVSTVVPDWASYEFRSFRGVCRRPALAVGDGPIATFVVRSSGKWRRRGAASDCGKPRNVIEEAWRDLVPACDDFDLDGTPLE